ncbi:MAG: ATP-binding cassette domain-containing protein [Actinomycetia bacterium]|nr:ATP-binding cassette domain-containing protein [Actinomycetes bacterium]
MIELQGVTKQYGSTLAVADLSATIRPGVVTGFLGPNGAGKSTTMRMIVGLHRPTKGVVLVNGHPHGTSLSPITELGAVLDLKAVQPNRTARSHLAVMAATHGIPMGRVDELLAITGLTAVAKMRLAAFSLGMAQRLAIAAALLGDPSVLIFDEPINGLDPEGVAWVRVLLRQQAALGKTVLVSSHLMSEMQHTADQVLIVGRGRLLADIAMADFIAQASGVAARLVSPDAEAIAAAFAGPGVTPVALAPGQLELRGVGVQQIAERAAERGWVIYQLAPVEVSLEDAYLRLTAGAVEYVSGGTTISEAYATTGPAWRPPGVPGADPSGLPVPPLVSPYGPPPPVPPVQPPAGPYGPPPPVPCAPGPYPVPPAPVQNPNWPRPPLPDAAAWPPPPPPATGGPLR